MYSSYIYHAYIGLSGCRLGPSDLLLAGIATHYIPSARLPELEQQIEEQLTPDPEKARKQLRDILKSYHEEPPSTAEQVAEAGGGRNHTTIIKDNMDKITLVSNLIV